MNIIVTNKIKYVVNFLHVPSKLKKQRWTVKHTKLFTLQPSVSNRGHPMKFFNVA